MDFSALMRLRGLGYDAALDNASLFFKVGFIATFTDRKLEYRVNYFLRDYIMEVFLVARKSASAVDRKTPGQNEPVSWINVSLSDEDVQQIEAWLADEPDLLSDVCQLVANGYAVSCKPASNGDGYMATLIGRGQATGNGLCGLSAYSDAPYFALAALLFKFVSKLDGRFTASVSASKAKFR